MEIRTREGGRGTLNSLIALGGGVVEMLRPPGLERSTPVIFVYLTKGK